MVTNNKIKIGAWNTNGWNSDRHPENTIFKCSAVNSLELDVVFITETFCKKNDILSITNYQVVQFNRQNISSRSIRGSGGCAIALSNKFMSNHVIVATYRGRQDGILAVKLRCTENDMLIGLLVNYLPPHGFHYGKDPESFFLDNSLVFSDLSDCDLLVAGGDLNSRTKDDLDYIPDVDGDTPPRINPDQERNNHGKCFLQFLKDNRALICNGRITPEQNDFTFVSPQGRSVPDYIYCPADHINYCLSLKVVKVSDVINEFNLPVPHTLPDHSIIVSEFDMFASIPRPDRAPEAQARSGERHKSKKNIRKIPVDFMCSDETMALVNSAIVRIESSLHTQGEVDSIYSDIRSIFASEIDKLPNIPSSKSKHGQKMLRKAAPFWNNDLSELWKARCRSENLYLSFKCDGKNNLQRAGKRTLLSQFKADQKVFDKAFRQEKRQFENNAFKSLADLAEKASNDPAEMWKRLKALSDRKSSAVLLEIIRQDGSISTDKKEVLEKWYSDFSECFKGIKDDPDLVFDDSYLESVVNLKNDFDRLSCDEQETKSSFDPTLLNCDITHAEVSAAIDNAKLGKAFLFVPNEALKNDQAKNLLHKLFNICFKTGLSPNEWSKTDLKPLFKGGDKDPRNPLDHRPICIMSCIAKIYSCVLNVRLQNHLESNNLLSDTQNGFRAGRSCIDHIFSLVTILRNRKLQGKETFICFVDFRRAFDSVNHNLLFHVLSTNFGIVGKMYKSLLSLYKNPATRVILTSEKSSMQTDYFDCPLGVKQGDILSPTLFSIFVNSLTVDLKNSNIGVSLDSPSGAMIVNHLVYADDLVCIAENPDDLQSLINIVNLWCVKFRIEANLTKTEVMHVRKPSVSQSKFKFRFGARNINYCKNYKYLGLHIDQHLDFEKMSNSFCDPASRALSAVMCKMIKNKGFPFNIFQMLYNCCVTSITDYSHEVIGFHQYTGSASIHTKAIRAYLGVGHSANLCGLRSEMGWLEPRSRTQIRMMRYFLKLRKLPDERLTKKIFICDQYFMQQNPNLQCWSSEIKDILVRNNLVFSFDNVPPKLLCKNLEHSLLSKDISMFQNQCSKSPKLRTYNSLFSPFNVALSENFTRLCLPFIVRKRLSQLRLGVLPLRIETDRYQRVKNDASERFCKQPKCTNNVATAAGKTFYVEHEFHFLLECKQYDNLRNVLLGRLSCPEFDQLNNQNKFCYMLTRPSVARIVGQFIIDAFDERPVKI